MNKKIKIIDLYNMIANKEKIPKKIKYAGEVYHHNIFKSNYFRDDNGSHLDFMDLNDEVEILEDNTEEIEELEELEEYDYINKYDKIDIQENRLKINKLIRAVKQMRKEKEND